MTENDYVATATAEKRLREVLATMLPESGVEHVAQILLTDAEITYLPRKKSVSILLRYPEKASQAILDRPRTTLEDQHVAEYGDKATYDEAQLARVYGDGPVDNNPGNDNSIPELSRVARFGEFVPTVTSNQDSDYFTE